MRYLVLVLVLAGVVGAFAAAPAVSDTPLSVTIMSPSNGYITSKKFPVTVRASFTDVSFTATHSCSVTFVGTTQTKMAAGTIRESGGAGTCTASSTLGAADTWSVTATVTRINDSSVSATSNSIMVKTI